LEAKINEIARLNWALSAYAKALSAIFHFDSFVQVTASICAAVVEQEEYVLAAVGLTELSPGMPISIVAGAGPAIAYLNDLELCWSDSVTEGMAPTDLTIDGFRPVVMSDCLKDPLFAPWRERARRHGIRSSVTVPFRSGDDLSGVLIIYAKVANAFGAHELELFQNLAQELALAAAMSDARRRMGVLEAAQRHADEVARAAQLDLERAARILSVSEVTTSIAHEVNQPIAAILANAETAMNWIAKSPPNLEGARQAIARVIRDAERAGDTVKQVRRLITRQSPNPLDYALNDIVEEALSVMEHEIGVCGVTLHRQLSTPSPTVRVDKVQIEQVLVNLISNSLESMKCVGQEPPRTLQVRTSRAGLNRALVSIEDNGVGLDAALSDKIFEHFVTTKEGGIGLGLPLCRAILQDYGGEIWAGPADNRGAVFQFTIPVSRSEGDEWGP
jgi:signal transduction histidine kinase